MAKVKIENGRTYIKCPGCKTTHCLNTDPASSPCWGFNGDMEKPTFIPSILEKSGHYCWKDGKPASECMYCNDPEFKDDESPLCYICHSFVRDGMIEFLGDCTHMMAGKTVELLDFDE